VELVTMSNAVPAVDLGVVERLDEKIRQLIALVEKTRAEATRLRSDNERLTRDVESLQVQLTDAAGVATELQAMREERDQVRARVADMLAQLDALQL
jgi:FtsZ-binding cell division protein ZapB